MAASVAAWPKHRHVHAVRVQPCSRGPEHRRWIGRWRRRAPCSDVSERNGWGAGSSERGGATIALDKPSVHVWTQMAAAELAQRRGAMSAAGLQSQVPR